MGLLEESLAAQASKQKFPVCGVSKLPDDVRAELEELLTTHQDLGLDVTDIADGMARSGHDLKANTLRRHKRGDCACEPL